MTINDFIYYAIDNQYVEIYSLDAEVVVWSGWSDEIPEEYLDKDFHSWNCIPKKYTGGICFNID